MDNFMTGTLFQVLEDGTEELWWADEGITSEIMEEYFKEFKETEFDEFGEFMESEHPDINTYRVFTEEIYID